MRKESFWKSGLLRFARNDEACARNDGGFSFMDCRAPLAMTRVVLAMTVVFFMLLSAPLFAQEASQQQKTPEPTTITIKNARQTTYEKDEKNDTDTIVLEGAVEIEVKKGSTSSEIKADKVTYDRKTEMLFAEGGVEITTKSSGSGGGETTTASSLLMNTSTLEGIFEDGRVVQTKSDALNLPSGSTLIVFSDIFGKSEDNTIAFKNSSLTFCDEEDPHWHIDASRTWLLPGGEFAFLNALLYVGPVPVLYFPAFYYPKDELIYNPVFGSRPREGKYVQTTFYLKGRKPLSNSTGSGSSSGSSGSDKNADSASEESLKAVYNFMKPTELKEQERQGLMLHNLDQTYRGDTSTYIKILGDWYTNLGGMVGIDGKLKPSKTYITNLEFNTLLGFSKTIFQSGTEYTFLSKKGNMYYDKSNFLGLKLPFRYGANLNFSLSKPFRLSVSLPIYSDPFFQNDFKTRDESMEWISYLLDLSNGNKDSAAVSESSVSQLIWKLNASYQIPLPQIIKPYLNTISLNFESSININRLDRDSASMQEDERYKTDNEWKTYTPERSFYYPSQVTPVNASVAINGTIFQWPLKQIASDTKKVSYPYSLTKPDELKTPSELEKELKQRQEEEARLQQNESENNDKAEQTPKQPASNEQPENTIPKPQLFELETSSASASVISGLTYKLDYNVNTNINTQISYSSTDKDGKTYLKTPEDFDWNKIRSFMYTIKSPVNLTSNLGYGGSFFSMKNSFSYDPLWQGHPNTDGYTDTKKKELIKADYTAQSRNFTNTNSISIRPFAYIPAFSETGLTWNNTMKIYRKKFTGDADKLEWEEKWLDFEDDQSITANSLTLTLGMKELDSRFRQTISLSSTLKPLTAKYSGSLNLVFPYVSFSLSTGVYEKSKTDKTLQFNPLSQSMSVNLFNSTLKFSQSFSYVYNDNTDKKDSHPENLKLSLSYKQLSVAFNCSYTYKYDLFINSSNDAGKKGYVQHTNKEFTPYSASLSYSLPSKTHYSWFNRITWNPGLRTAISYDFIKPTNSYFEISPSLTFNINNFFKLTFSATSRNSSVYWYFQDRGKFASDDFYGDNFASRFFADLVQSFGIYGVNGWGWESQAFRKNREASGFKLKSMNLTLTHELHDWDFNMSIKFEPKIVNVNNVKKYVYDPYVSIGIVWNPMQSIKTNLTYEYKEKEDDAIWVLK